VAFGAEKNLVGHGAVQLAGKGLVGSFQSCGLCVCVLIMSGSNWGQRHMEVPPIDGRDMLLAGDHSLVRIELNCVSLTQSPSAAITVRLATAAWNLDVRSANNGNWEGTLTAERARRNSSRFSGFIVRFRPLDAVVSAANEVRRLFVCVKEPRYRSLCWGSRSGSCCGSSCVYC
jgi:hypothetical protein